MGNKGDVIGYIKVPNGKTYKERFTLLQNLPFHGILGIDLLRKLEFKCNRDDSVDFAGVKIKMYRGPRGDSFGRRNMATAIATLEAKFLCRPNTSVGTSALGSFFQDNVGPNQPSGRKTGHFFLRKMILMGKILHKDDQRVNVILDQTIPTEEAVNVRSSSRRLPEATNPGIPSESDRGDSREG